LTTDLTRLVARITASYLRRNAIAATEIPAVIRAVHNGLASAGAQSRTPSGRAEPAVPVSQSVQPDHVVCLSCGFRAKTLRRHLRTAHGLTVEAYRRHWNLAPNHPITAPEYAERRSRIAKSSGLGAARSRPR
jgi:predicted transcriptional regulator